MNLPEDVFIDILSRLPVRSLIRLKCVSKKWYSIIESPSFIDLHMTLQVTRCNEHIRILQRIRDRDQICILDCDPHRHIYIVLNCFDDIDSLSHLTPPDIELPGYHDPFDFPEFVGHANGIVCIANKFSKITLWNPVLREFRMLPSLPSCCVSGFHSLLFAVGFGFDHVTNDYKVVCLETIFSDDQTLEVRNPSMVDAVQVYNLKTNSWKRLETRPPQLVRGDCGRRVWPPIFFQGCAHWCVWTIDLKVILTFNITSELFDKVQCPRGYEEYNIATTAPRLLILDMSTLSFVVSFHRADTHGQIQLDIWVMNDYHVKKDSWTKLYSIAPESKILQTLCFWKKDKVLFWTNESVLICYDLLTGEEHHLRAYDIPDPIYVGGAIEALTCIETLVSIK